jgi:hypothetical protein
MLVGSYKWLGTLPFIRHDPEGFKEYTRHLAAKDSSSTDNDFELAHWQCNSSQIGILLLQRMGFSSARLTPLMRATMALSANLPPDPIELGLRAVDLWLKYILESSASASVPLQAAYYLSSADINVIINRLTDPATKTHRGWLSVTKHSISIEETPQLFSAIHNANNSSGEPAPQSSEEAPIADTLLPTAAELSEEIDSIIESNFSE